MKPPQSGFTAGKYPDVVPLTIPEGTPAKLQPANVALYPSVATRVEAPKPKRKYASSTRKIAFQTKGTRAFPGLSI